MQSATRYLGEPPFDVNTARSTYLAHYPKEGLKCAIHSCAVFLGMSQSDELEETANYLIRLSDMTSGTHMTAVLPNYIR